MAHVPAALHDQLAAARSAGADFDSAWPGAVQVALRHGQGEERRYWPGVLADTREVWRAAYMREPPPPALRRLGNLRGLTVQ